MSGDGVGQYLIGVGQGVQQLVGNSRKVLRQHSRAVVVAFGEDDVYTQGKGLTVLNLGDQLGKEVARPRPLSMLDQTLAIDADNDHRFAVAHPRHQALILVELGFANIE